MSDYKIITKEMLGLIEKKDKTITPRDIFEAYIEKPLSKWIIENQSGSVVQSEYIKDLFSEPEFKNVDSVFLSLLINRRIIQAIDRVAEIGSHYLSNEISDKTLCQIEQEYCHFSCTSCTQEANRQHDVLNAIIMFYSDSDNEINENHLLMAKNDKDTFETLLLSQYNKS